jgi:ribonuclease Z
MKPSFHARLVNGPLEDPGLYVRLLREGRALMFDMGFTTGLSARDILKTTHIFVSHTHIDHFIGFDSILRVCLKREKILRLYGPEGFIGCVEGKLKSYTWNLIETYPLALHVSEITAKQVKTVVFKAKNSFTCEDPVVAPFRGILVKDPLITVSAEILDHQIPCLAFSVAEENHINIDKARLNTLNLTVGPWLNELKSAVRENRINSHFFIDGQKYSYSEVRNVATITRGQKLSYVVDAAGTEKNLHKIIKLVRGSDVLYIETYFLDEDRDRARARHHLTAKEAGWIARKAKVGRMEPVHFSPKYAQNPEMLVQEAEREFRR